MLVADAKGTIVLPFAETDQRTPYSPVSEFQRQPLADPKTITIVIPSSRRRLELELSDQIRVGRIDTEAGIFPELDLTEDDGAEMGVSRVHAVIQASNQGLALIDLDSTNGTLLNNSPLSPNLPYPLATGDEIRFGELLVHVLF